MIARLILLTLASWAAAANAQEPFDPFGAATIVERPGARIPTHAPLRDSHGRATTIAALARERPVLLAPVLHNCPNFCGATLAGLADVIALQELQPGRDFAVIALGIDPRESTAAAAADLARLRARPSGRMLADVHALVGPERSIHAITAALGYRYAWDNRIGQYAHVAAVAVLTPDGRLSSWLYGLTPQPSEFGPAILAASEGRDGHWSERLLLLCYHYDPATGRYTPSIWKMLRLAGVATVLAMALLFFRLWRRRI